MASHGGRDSNVRPKATVQALMELGVSTNQEPGLFAYPVDSSPEDLGSTPVFVAVENLKVATRIVSSLAIVLFGVVSFGRGTLAMLL